jgi:hypothetical protein
MCNQLQEYEVLAGSYYIRSLLELVLEDSHRVSESTVLDLDSETINKLSLKSSQQLTIP